MQELEGLLGEATLPLLQVVHELRAPIASIRGTLDVLVEGYATGGTPVHDEMLRLTRDRASAMLRLVNDLLDLGKIENRRNVRKAVPVRLDDGLWSVLPEMRINATLRTVELVPEVQQHLPLIAADQEHVAQLLSNLIDNAIKYTDPGGRVVVQLYERGNRVVGKVEDSGIGIAPEDRERIFAGFYRAKNAKEVEPYGTGLGLPLVMRIVEMYDGVLELESELGKGSTFTFSFPRLEEEANSAAVLAAEEQR